VSFPRSWNDAPDDSFLSQETQSQIRACIDALPASQRAVVELRDVHGFSAEETCSVLEISEVTQRVLLYRGRSKVRRALELYLTGTSAQVGSRQQPDDQPSNHRPEGAYFRVGPQNGSGLSFVVEPRGLIRFAWDGEVQPELFLDLSQVVSTERDQDCSPWHWTHTSRRTATSASAQQPHGPASAAAHVDWRTLVQVAASRRDG
jgi:hypothetical protein